MRDELMRKEREREREREEEEQEKGMWYDCFCT
jgi:hypothetical protein